MSPGLLKVRERAKRDPDARFNSLAHLLDGDALMRSYDRIRNNAAVGIDGITREGYGYKLLDNLVDLYQRLRSKRSHACRRP
jgi:RNA-directed DNA polymerase